jgi:hypothetical protein
MTPRKPVDQEAPPHATHPPEERGTHIIDLINPNDAARWLTLADAALGRGASAVEVAETEVLARKEQDAIKRRIRRRSEQVNRQSKSEQ